MKIEEREEKLEEMILEIKNNNRKLKECLKQLREMNDEPTET